MNKISCSALAVWLCLLATAVFAEERMAVTAPVANIRSGPSSAGAPVVWKVGQFHPIVVIEKKGSWYRFKDFEGDIGWVHSSLLGKIDTVITIKDKCNIRSGSSTNDGVVFTAEKGVPFKVLARKGRWIQIQHADGDRGWIHDSLVW